MTVHLLLAGVMAVAALLAWVTLKVARTTSLMVAAIAALRIEGAEHYGQLATKLQRMELTEKANYDPPRPFGATVDEAACPGPNGKPRFDCPHHGWRAKQEGIDPRYPEGPP